MKKLILLIFALLLVLPMVIAVPPTDTITNVNVETGITVVSPLINTIKQNEDLHFYVHAFNISNGIKLSNDTTSCSMHIHDNTMEKIFDSEMEVSDHGSWKLTIDKGNFTRLGEYAFAIQCNNSYHEGFRRSRVFVTKTGNAFTTEKSIIYVGLLGILILLLITSVLAIHFIPDKDIFDDENKLISINHLKYLRLPMGMISWFLLLGILFVSSNIALAFLDVTLIGDLLFSIFKIMMLLSYPMVILVFIYLIYRVLDDKRLKKFYERGFDNEDG